ncbi:hypothetical protein [Sporosarcina koreensis]|uniref:hypothetical protein n=1 Tax=Sporosarcina koreensis TaxID=334735 RepID=UPI00075982B2|nr:hypothetical protein [Sporosarcina koreensis]
MNRKIGKRYLCLMIFLLTALSACAPSSVFDLYQGKSLKIAVVGEAPEVKEEQVEFVEITFTEMKDDEDYDAVIIRESNLLEASESQYAEVYLRSTIPFFFIGASNTIPFTVKDVEFDKTWEWAPGVGYAVGVLTMPEEVRHWSYGLYNDEKTDEHIQEMYARIFETIGELHP